MSSTFFRWGNLRKVPRLRSSILTRRYRCEPELLDSVVAVLGRIRSEPGIHAEMLRARRRRRLQRHLRAAPPHSAPRRAACGDEIFRRASRKGAALNGGIAGSGAKFLRSARVKWALRRLERISARPPR